MLLSNPSEPKHTVIAVMLSVPLRSIHSLTTDCVADPTASWIVLFLLFFMALQAYSITSYESSFSKSPSQPRIMKSSFPVSVYLHIYGSVLMQFFMPPSSGYLA